MKTSRPIFLAMILMFSIASANVLSVSAQNSEIVVDSQIEWIEDRALEENLRIVSGGELTINGLSMTISDGVSVIVEEGGILNVRESSIKSENPPSGLAGYGYWEDPDRSAVLIPGSDFGASFSATFFAPEGYSFYGGQAIPEGSDPVDTNGSQFTLQFDENTENIWVGLVAYGHQEVRLASVTLTPDVGSAVSYDAIDLESRNMKGLDTDSETCLVDIDGDADIADSSFLGCEVVVNGTLTLHSTALDRTGPLFVNADGEITLSGSTSFAMSTDDHDVRAHAKANLYWGDDVIGSGGFTDRWERIMGPQIVEFDAVEVLFRILDFGPQETTSSTFFSDENGIGLIDGGKPRTVEIGWADGGVWTESATIDIISYETAWNPQADHDNDGQPDSGIGHYGGDLIPLTWDEVIVIDDNVPYIEFVSVDYQTPAESVSRGSGGVGMMATIANRGTASAIVYFTCDVTETGLGAQMTSFPGGLVEAGEEVTIQFSWSNSDVDNASLTCEILTPTQLANEDAFGGGTASSEQITWINAEDDDEGTLLPVIIAFVIAVLGMAAFFFRMTKSSDEDEELY